LAGRDPEDELRAVARGFADKVRAAEQAARQAGVDPTAMVAEQWRLYWPVSLPGNDVHGCPHIARTGGHSRR
jgi:hypothetical protein